MDGGVIAWIVVGSLLVLSLIVACIYFFAIKKKKWSDITSYLKKINNPVENTK
jgi:uncharacterized BrkB/YihY/UPF0761 family membrane protein